MNRNEYKLYKQLIIVLRDKYFVFPQVHLDELVYPKKNNGKRVFSFRHINQKSVDFVICAKNGVRSLLAIELDGNSHFKKEIIDRDIEVERILKEISLPLLRLKNNETLTDEELLTRVENSIIKGD